MALRRFPSESTRPFCQADMNEDSMETLDLLEVPYRKIGICRPDRCKATPAMDARSRLRLGRASTIILPRERSSRRPPRLLALRKGGVADQIQREASQR